MGLTNISKTEILFSLGELEAIYAGTSLEGKCEVLFKKPKDESDLLEHFMSSKLWRLNNCYKIINKKGKLVTMHMNYAQHRVYARFLKHSRLLILKSRQQGISTFWMVFFFDMLLFYPNKTAGLMSQGIDESSSLLTKLGILWRNVNPYMLSKLRVGKLKDNSKLFELTNDSRMLVRTSFRSGTLQALHISEMGKIANNYPQRAEEVKTGSLQAIAKGLPVIIESTAEGVNEFKYMWDTAVKYNNSGKVLAGKDFYPLFLSWLDDPDCVELVQQEETKEGKDYFDTLATLYALIPTQPQRNFWETQYRELGLKIYQEYPATPEEAFKASLEGSYYGSYIAKYLTRGNNRIRSNLYEKELPITISADLGTNDEFVLGFWQFWGGEHRLIREYSNSDKLTKHYIDTVKHYYKESEIREILLPHDAKRRDDNTHDTRYDEFRRGFPRARVRVLKRTNSIIDDIQQVRKLLPKLVVDVKCSYLIDCLMNYSKERDDRRQVWKELPNHDEFSHGADCIRYYAVGNRSEKTWDKHYNSPRDNGRDSYEV